MPFQVPGTFATQAPGTAILRIVEVPGACSAYLSDNDSAAPQQHDPQPDEPDDLAYLVWITMLPPPMACAAPLS